ncbi:MAG: hypothetical protein JWL72_2227, partial [Ilumatobacteraceae bacterium]|nr:hypothetical protein [Ilumatobacteraceae bacterium]
ATHTVHLGACVSTWSLAGNTLTFSASNLPANCLDLNGLSPEDLALFDEITATTPATLVADPVRESIIFIRGTSALRLHQLTQPAPTDSFDLYQAVVLGFSVGQVISPEDVAAALTPARGPATHDTRWYTASTGVVGDGATQCLSGLELRTLWWGDVSIAFWRRNGTESIWAWSIGDRRASLWEDRREPTAPDHPAASGITTAGSLHVGSPATDLQVQFADIMDPLAPRLEDGTQIYLSAMSTEPTVWQFDRDRDVNVGVSIKGGEVTGFGAALDACSSSSSSPAGGAALTPSGALDLHLERATPTTPSVFGFAYGSDGDPTMIASTVSDVLGQPQQDTGWQPMPADLSCKGATEYRSILWADLRFVFEGYDTDGDGTTDRTRLAAWSIGAVQLELSPHLDAVITQHSAITTADGLGLGSPKSAVLEQNFFQIGDDGDTVFGLAKAVPVRFVIADDRVASMSVQDNDC